jgi:1-acyl-sn-glycerol-3-phosphate acyltransferase
MRALGMIPINREDPAAARRALDDAAAKFGRQVSLVIFPEGTRAPARCMLPFKSGAFVFAIQAQVPVVPVALHNTAQVMPAHGYLSIPGGRIVVEFLDPISTAGLTLDDRHALKERVRTALVAALRPDDGGVAQRPDLGSFAGHACGVRRTPVVPHGDGATGAHPLVASAGNAPDAATPALAPAADGHDPPGRAA